LQQAQPEQVKQEAEGPVEEAQHNNKPDLREEDEVNPVDPQSLHLITTFNI
jgi:hypothetical protein